ncbi:MAG: ectoine hydroxylase, partial [Bordetella sp.]|nr:ectoine hydroxylase [Bordetella sp.]
MISPAKDPYASRTDRGSAIIARQDPVVYGDGKYADALSTDQVQSYERDGFLLLEDVFSADEVAHLLGEVERMPRDPAIIRREEAIT